MTEEEWLSSNDPLKMCKFLTQNITMKWGEHKPPPTPEQRKPNDRKLRLFAAACSWLHGDAKGWDEWAGRGSKIGEYTGEDAALFWCGKKVGQSPEIRLAPVEKAKTAALLREVFGDPFRRDHVHVPYHRAKEWFTPQVLSLARTAYQERGSGFRIGSNGQSYWHNGADGTLDPLRLAILADALEEAGYAAEDPCPDGWMWSDDDGSTYPPAHPVVCRCRGVRRVPSPLLTHLRSPGPHVRGCWVLDIVLEE